jgi:hypothetical protein
MSSPSRLHSETLKYNLTNYTEHRFSWEIDRRSAGQKIPDLLRNSKVHNRDHKSSPLDPTLNQSHPVHILTPAYFFKICFNVILPSMPTSLKWYLPFPYLPFPSLRIF